MSAALIENFDLLANSLGGVAKLRELILNLAVRGQLVPQDPNDEPASVLLQKIRVEKDRLIKKGTIKQDKPLAEIGEDEKPYELPEGWEWVRLARLGEWAIGSGFPNAEQGLTDQEILFAKVSDMNLLGNEKEIHQTNNSISGETAARIRINVHVAGTVVFPKIGGAIATNKRRILVKPTAIDNNCLGITPHRGCGTPYLYLLLTSIDFTKYQAGTSVPALSQGVLGEIVVALPPLAEQSRIVAKVEELMALCDRLEAEQGNANRVQGHWVQVALDRLSESRDADDFRRHWQHLASHWDQLFTTPASITALEATLRQLAVRGKLVAQIANVGEPIPTDVQTSEFLPKSWGWSRFGDLIEDLRYGTSHKCSYEPHGVPVLRIPNLVGERISCSDLKYGPLSQDELDRLKLRSGDLLMIRSNGSAGLVGRAALVDPEAENFAFAGYLVRIRLHTRLMHPKFALLVLATASIREQIEGPIRTTSGVKNINSTEIKSLYLPVPPLDEQARIVTRIENLLSLTAELKARLATAQTKQAHLAEVLIAETC